MDLTAALAAARAELATMEAARRRFWAESEGSRDWSPMDDRIDDQALVVADLSLKIEQAAWTRDVTAARRAEWNAWVKANATKKGVPAAAVVAQEKRQGWSVPDLRAAVARHGL